MQIQCVNIRVNILMFAPYKILLAEQFSAVFIKKKHTLNLKINGRFMTEKEASVIFESYFQRPTL